MNYLSTRRQIEGALPTAAEMLRLKNEIHALRILALADIELVETGVAPLPWTHKNLEKSDFDGNLTTALYLRKLFR